MQIALAAGVKTLAKAPFSAAASLPAEHRNARDDRGESYHWARETGRLRSGKSSSCVPIHAEKHDGCR
jgi:hypothetical protein